MGKFNLKAYDYELKKRKVILEAYSWAQKAEPETLKHAKKYICIESDDSNKISYVIDNSIDSLLAHDWIKEIQEFANKK